jgi:hypothetical protein
MRGGRLITYCMLSSIAIKTYPTKTTYVDGDAIDLSGITILATYQDGTTKEITSGFTVECSAETASRGDTEYDLTVTYSAYDVTCTVTDKYQLKKVYSTLEALVATDFEYTENEDGTITLTDWKGTVNGVESTEFVVPDDENIIM